MQPPWGDRTNHGGGWVVGRPTVRGLYSRTAREDFVHRQCGWGMLLPVATFISGASSAGEVRLIAAVYWYRYGLTLAHVRRVSS